MCQWGTERWATMQGKDYRWMVSHYYPGTTIAETYVPPVTDYAARAGEHSAPIELVSGDTAMVYLEYINDGQATWDARTQIGTTVPRDRASPFATSTWLSSHRPVAATMGAPGGVVRFQFEIRAPQVKAAMGFVEHFGLIEGEGMWFGPADDAVALEIMVRPRPAGAGAQPTDTPGPPRVAEGGCTAAGGGRIPARLGSFVLVLLGAAFSRARRRARIS
jgi:hypothetical protein